MSDDVPFITKKKHRPARCLITSFCLVVQGAKDVLLGQERLRYSPTDYLVASVHLPITAQITEATPDIPYLGQ